MLVRSTLRDLVLATWQAPPAALTPKLPAGLELETTASGDALVSLVGMRVTRSRSGRLPLPGFSQVTLRTYVIAEDGPAVFFLGLRVTAGGLGGALIGLPVRAARLRVRDGLVQGGSLGLSVRYRCVGASPEVPVLPSGPLGHHDVAYLYSAGVRRLATTHDPFRWEAAELLEKPRLEPLQALGLDVGMPDSLLYAASTRFELQLPPVKAGESVL
ncbi:MAG: DUF2071 domain-containing protein [Gaiellales bacterium]